MNISEPHQLDFDWRFSTGTIEKVLALISGGENDVLLIGTPSLAVSLDSRGTHVTLVDRQPIQSIDQVRNTNPDFEDPITGTFGIVILDPPWYEDTFFRWISWAAQSLDISNGVMYCSIWQPETRPKGNEERNKIFEWLETWADYSILENFVEYVSPLFEERAYTASGLTLNPLWRKGDLLEIRPKLRPPLTPPLVRLEEWHRIIINSYQLAIRVDTVIDSKISKHPMANGWVWKSVSMRAQGRSQIGLWSSRNEVAIIKGSQSIITAVNELVHFGKITNDNLTSLLEWEIPKSNIYHYHQWKHQN